MGKKYKNPPVLEALCEFHFPREVPWDLTVPGLFYDLVSKDFPHKDQRVIQEMDIAHNSKEVEQKIRRADRMLFYTEDRRNLIQLGMRFLSVNCLKPYTGWEDFKPRIEKALQNLNKVVEITSYQKLALHYINKISIKAEKTEITDFFQFGINLGTTITQPMIDFFAGCSIPFADQRDICRIQLASTAPESPELMSFMLDINYFAAHAEKFTPQEAFNWIDYAHRSIEDVFEGCITDRLRDLFEEVK